MNGYSHMNGYSQPATVTRAIIVACLTVLVQVSVGKAQDPELARLRSEYGGETTTQVRELTAGAERKGVPPAPILDRALEGAAKGVPAERLLPALESYRERLFRSRRALGPDVDARALSAGAAALRRDVPAGTLRQVAALARRDATIPLLVLGELVALGVAPEEAAAVIGRTLRRPGAHRKLLRMPVGLRRAMRSGAPPPAALRRVEDALERGSPPASMSEVGTERVREGGGHTGGGPGGVGCC